MTTVSEVLQRYSLDLTEHDVAQSLDDALRTVPGVGSAPLTGAEVDYLTEHGGGGTAETITGWDPEQERGERVRHAVRAVDQVLAGTVDIPAAAALIGVDRTRISHRLSAGTLYAITVGSRRRIPMWQFHGGAELPHLAIIVAAIPALAHPLDVGAAMTTAQAELAGRTAVDHLATGGNPEPVVDLLATLTRW